MVSFESLPPEVLCVIAEMCEVPALYGKNPATKYRYHAFLARTCRYLYGFLNPFLYQRHIKNDPPVDSCMLWAAESGNLGTIKLAKGLGVSLDTNGTRDDNDLDLCWDSIPGRRRWFATPLHLAFRSGHRHIVEYLLENGASPHVPTRDFVSPYGKDRPYVLEYMSNCIESTKILVRYGANLLQKDKPALPYFAREKYDPDLLCLFLEQNIPEVTAQALRCGAQYRIPELFYRALKKPELNASMPDPSDGKVAFHCAAASGDKAFVEALLVRPDVNVTARDNEGAMPIHYAAAKGKLDIVDLLLQQSGVEISAPDHTGCTILHYVCDAEGDTKVMRSLVQQILDAGVSINQPSSTGTALFHAVKHNNYDIALFLLSKGADPTVGPLVDKRGWTMLHHCLYKKDRMETRTQLVREIASRGVDLEHDAHRFPGVDLSEEWMYLGPPLYFAAAYAESPECMNILIDAGADPNSGAICVGIDEGFLVRWGDVHPALCALFDMYIRRRHGGDINHIRGQVCLLLDRGYSLDYGGTGNSAGCPLDWATRRKLPKVVKLILDNASSKNITFGHLMQHIRELDGDDRTEYQEILQMLVEFRQREFAGFETGGEEDDWDCRAGEAVEEEGEEEEEEEEEGEEEEDEEEEEEED